MGTRRDACPEGQCIESERWQPIETAPTDGKTQFLAYDKATGQMDVCLMENIHISTRTPYWVCRATSWDWDNDSHPDFTHWMPLPEPHRELGTPPKAVRYWLQAEDETIREDHNVVIRQLSAEIERLQNAYNARGEWGIRLAQVEAKVERLRAALQSIVDWNDGPASGLNWTPLMIMARAALDAGQPTADADRVVRDFDCRIGEQKMPPEVEADMVDMYGSLIHGKP